MAYQTMKLSLLAALVATPMVTAQPASADSPFQALVGTWNGKGTARLEGGKSERMSCKGYYSGKGSNTLRLAIICANPSTKVELRSVLKYANGRVSGTWEERNYNQEGTITGTASSDKLVLEIGGGAIEGTLSVSMKDAGQSVSISTDGSVLKAVNIDFARQG